VAAGAVRRLDRVAGSAWFAYASILLLQSKLLWGIWDHLDLSSGDTSNYFLAASGWSNSLHVNPVHYPLYTVPWGSLMWLVGDPYAVTILYRALIALGASLMVLAVMRRLVSPRIAWALAVWWTVVPVNYDNLYEGNLYSVITTMAAVLIACAWRGTRMRAAVFGVLLLNTLFMRSETLFALVVWSAVWLADELRLRRAGRPTPRPVLIRAVAIPVLIALVLGAAALALDPRRADFFHSYKEKQAVNACESYAVGYAQRHSDFRQNPFNGCQPLAQREFGTRLPTWVDEATSNPGALAGHFRWNAELVPQGLQLMLFDAISGGPNRDPDYLPVHTGSTWSFAGLVAVILFCAGGLTLLWRDRRRWWRTWIRERAWGWVALIGLGATAAVVMIWERPRPGYAFGGTVLILALVGMSAMAFAGRWPILRRAGAAIPIAAILLLILVPARYTSGYLTPQDGRPGRPIKRMVDRLYPIRDRLDGRRVRLLATYAGAGCNYVASEDPCKAIFWKRILARDPGTTVAQALERQGTSLVYVDEDDMRDPARAAATHEAEAAGWVREPISAGQGWALLAPPG
jgi:hypothetical protein